MTIVITAVSTVSVALALLLAGYITHTYVSVSSAIIMFRHNNYRVRCARPDGCGHVFVLRERLLSPG